MTRAIDRIVRLAAMRRLPPTGRRPRSFSCGLDLLLGTDPFSWPIFRKHPEWGEGGDIGRSRVRYAAASEALALLKRMAKGA
jgi:hypothetical protein